MELHLYILILVLAAATLLLSIVYTKEQAYKVIFCFVSLILSVILAFSSFNIELITLDGGTWYTKQIYDYGLIGLSWAFIIISFVNTFIVLFVGSVEEYLIKRGV